MHAVRLLQAEILGTPLQARLVAAYVVGAYAPSDFGAIGLPVCDGPRETGCIRPEHQPDGARRRKEHGPATGDLRQSADLAPGGCSARQRQPRQPALPQAKRDKSGRTLPALTPHLTGAVCDESLLKVDIPWSAPSGFTMP